jgi:uncharacterized phage infection (PIP) family protein YhgE
MKPMFDILHDQKATADQLTNAFLFFESKANDVLSQVEKVHSALVELQQRSWAGQNVGKLMKETKADYENLLLEIDAAADAQDTLKRRLGERLKLEMEARTAEIDEEQNKLSSERKTARNEYLKACAKVAVLRERIEGPDMSFDRMGNMKIHLPVPKIDLAWLQGEEYSVYEKAVNEARGGKTLSSSGSRDIPESLARKASNLGTEKDKIEKALEVYDPVQAAEKHLRTAGSKAFPLPKPVPEESYHRRSGAITVREPVDPPGYENGRRVIEGTPSWGRTSG